MGRAHFWSIGYSRSWRRRSGRSRGGGYAYLSRKRRRSAQVPATPAHYLTGSAPSIKPWISSSKTHRSQHLKAASRATHNSKTFARKTFFRLTPNETRVCAGLRLSLVRARCCSVQLTHVGVPQGQPGRAVERHRSESRIVGKREKSFSSYASPHLFRLPVTPCHTKNHLKRQSAPAMVTFFSGVVHLFASHTSQRRLVSPACADAPCGRGLTICLACDSTFGRCDVVDVVMA